MEQSKSIVLRSAFPIRTKVISRAGHTHAEAIGAAAGIPGSFLTKQFKVVKKSDRIRRHFRFSWQNGASSCTESRACRPCSIRFSGSEIPLSLRNDVV